MLIKQSEAVPLKGPICCHLIVIPQPGRPTLAHLLCCGGVGEGSDPGQFWPVAPGPAGSHTQLQNKTISGWIASTGALQTRLVGVAW